MDPASFGDSEVQETPEPSQSEASDQIQPDPIPDDLSLASPFLSKIPSQDRNVVAKYIKEWDAGVTKKFQEYSGKLKNYEALGNHEDLQRYVAFANTVRNDPEKVFKLMWEGLNTQYGDEFESNLLRILELEAAMNEEPQYDPNQGYEQPDENQVFQQNVTSELEEIRQWKEQQEQARQFEEEKAQLDGVLEMMHNKFGDFDNTWIIQRLSEHGDVNKAVKEWNDMIGKYTQNGAQRQAPKVMGGHGGVPNEQVDMAKLKGKDRRDAVMGLLAQIGD